MNDLKQESSQGDSLARGGLGLLGGVVICGVAILAQAALLRAIAGPAKKTI